MLVYPEDKWHELSFSKLINFSNSDLVGGRKRARNNQVKFSAYMFEFYKIEIVTFNSCCEDLSFLCRGEWRLELIGLSYWFPFISSHVRKITTEPW